MADWTLYLDESGRAKSPQELFVFAGLLIRSPETPAAEARLREALEATFPLWPWPPHAAPLNLPASRLAAVALTQPAASEDARARALRDACAPLLRELEARPPATEKFQLRLASDRMPPVDAIKSCDGWLRSTSPTAYRRLARLCSEDERQMRLLVGRVAELCGSDATLVAAIGPGDEGLKPESMELRSDGWVQTLEALFERVLMLLWRQSGPSERLWVRVADRDVDVGGVQPIRRRGVPAMPWVIGDIARAAAAMPGLAPSLASVGGNVRVVPMGSPNVFDESVHPGLVLADWIANRVRRAALRTLPSRAREPGEGWAELRRELVRCGALGIGPSTLAAGLAPRCSPDRGEHPAVAGVPEARRRIQHAVRTSADVDVTDLQPSWARDQAVVWVGTAATGAWS